MNIPALLRDCITSCLPSRAVKVAPSSPKFNYSITNRIGTALHSLRNKLFHGRAPAGRYDDEPRQSWSLRIREAARPHSFDQGAHPVPRDAPENPALAHHSPSPPDIRHSDNPANLQLRSHKISQDPIPANVRKLMEAIQTGDLAALSTIEDLGSIVNTPLRCQISCAVQGEKLALRTPSPLELAVNQLTFSALQDQSSKESAEANEETRNSSIDRENNRIQIVKTLARAGGAITHPDAWGLLINKARFQLGAMSPADRFRLEADRFLNHLSAMCIFSPEQQHRLAYAAPQTPWSDAMVKELVSEAKTLIQNGAPYPVERFAQIYVSLAHLVAAMHNDTKSFHFYYPGSNGETEMKGWNERKGTELLKKYTEEIIVVLHKQIEHIVQMNSIEIRRCDDNSDCIHVGKPYLNEAL